MTDPVRVAVITTAYPGEDDQINGRFVHTFAAALHNAESVDVKVVHIHAQSRKKAGLKEGWQGWEGVRVLRLPWAEKSGLLPTMRGQFQAVRGIWEDAEFRAWRPDLLHVHFLGLTPHIRWSLRGLGWPYVVTVHSSLFGRRRLSAKDWLKASYGFGGAAKVLPVSRFLAARIMAHKLVRSTQVEIVPNFLDRVFWEEPLAQRTPPPYKLLSVARLKHIKGIDVALDALSRLLKVRQDWRYVVVGDGWVLPEGNSLDLLQQRAARLGLAEHVSFVGPKFGRELLSAYDAADLFVLPSRFETFSVATLEALSRGLPVIATECGGPEELVRAAEGTIVPVGDPIAMAGAMEQMLEELDTYEAAAIHEGARVRFGPEVQIGRLVSLYEEVLDGRS